MNAAQKRTRKTDGVLGCFDFFDRLQIFAVRHDLQLNLTAWACELSALILFRTQLDVCTALSASDSSHADPKNIPYLKGFSILGSPDAQGQAKPRLKS